MIEKISVRYGDDDAFTGHLFHPTKAKTPLPAVVVIQEAWGVDVHIEDVARRVAMAGYAAFAVDVFARDGERPPLLTNERCAEAKAFFDRLTPQQMIDPDERAKAMESEPEPLRTRLRESVRAIFTTAAAGETNLPPLLAATKWLREKCDVTRGQKIASVGFCMGGALSALLACHDPELAAAVIFYGMSPREELVAKLACPVLGLYGATDARINKSLPAFVAATTKHGKSFEHYVYEAAGHAFFNDTRATYDVRAARDAWVRTLAMFHEQ
ncbi:MAG: dienelactone hydrolase family protein, partial [Polyangiales bacterium]